MADPRKASTNRIGTNPVRPLTYKIDGVDIVYDAAQPNGSAAVGRAVMLSGNGIVRLVADASKVEGKLIHVEPDGYCKVECGGVVELPAGNAATVTAGSRIVGALGPASARGYIRNANSAVAAETLAAAHTIEDAADTTKVQVRLDG
jgi:hypothetical protein